MDDCNATTIKSGYKNLKIEQDNTKETKDDITKAFIKFIKEYRNGNIFKYRYINIFTIFMFNNIEINFNIISRKIFIN